MKSMISILPLIFVQCILADQAVLTAEIGVALAAFVQTLKTASDSTATFNGEYRHADHRAFSITDMVCTLTPAASTVSCAGGTLQVGDDGVSPPLAIQTSVLKYNTGTPDYLNGTVLARANAWTAYGFTLTNIVGGILLDNSQIDEVYATGSSSLDMSPKFALSNVVLKAHYKRGQATRMDADMTLAVFKQGEATSVPPLTVTARSTLGGGTSPVLDLQGTTSASWKPLGNGGPTVSAVKIEARLTNAGLVSIKVGAPQPFSFEYADFSLTVPSSVDISECGLPTCTYSRRRSSWGRRPLFSSTASLTMPGSEPDPTGLDMAGRSSTSATGASFVFGPIFGYTYTCTLDFAESCGWEWTTATLPANAEGSLTIDLVNSKAWGYLNLAIQGTIGGLGTARTGGIPVNIQKNVFPYSASAPFEFASLLANGDFSLCSLVPTSTLNLQIPETNSRHFFPITIQTGWSSYPEITIPKTAVPEYTIGGQTIQPSGAVCS